MGRKNALSTLSKIMVQNPSCAIIYFTTEFTKASCIQGVNIIRLTLNSALFYLFTLFLITKAIRRWTVLRSNSPKLHLPLIQNACAHPVDLLWILVPEYRISLEGGGT